MRRPWMMTSLILSKAANCGMVVCIMLHRHLSHQNLTLAAIDDIILRGKRSDWTALRDAARTEPEVLQKLSRVCRAHSADPFSQRYYFWVHYVERLIA